MNNRILIVEDDIDIAERLKDLLELEGYVADIAGNGLVALEKLEKANPKPGLILLDLMMPIMDGPQFREAQRARPALAKIPIVVMTAGRNIEEKAKMLDVPFYLKKPLDLDLLLDTMRTVLTASQ